MEFDKKYKIYLKKRLIDEWIYINSFETKKEAILNAEKEAINCKMLFGKIVGPNNILLYYSYDIYKQ